MITEVDGPRSRVIYRYRSPICVHKLTQEKKKEQLHVKLKCTVSDILSLQPLQTLGHHRDS